MNPAYDLKRWKISSTAIDDVYYKEEDPCGDWTLHEDVVAMVEKIMNPPLLDYGDEFTPADLVAEFRQLRDGPVRYRRAKRGPLHLRENECVADRAELACMANALKKAWDEVERLKDV